MNDNCSHIGYLSRAIGLLDRRMKEQEYPEVIAASMRNKIDSFKTLVEIFEFLDKPPAERQALRVSFVASLRKRNLETKDHIAAIKLYEQLSNIIPHCAIAFFRGTESEGYKACTQYACAIDYSYLEFGSDKGIQELHGILNSEVTKGQLNDIHLESKKMIEDFILYLSEIASN